MSTSTTTTLVLTGLTPPSQWYINADTTITLPTIQRYGWNYNSALTVDRNYMNLAYCIARNSYCLEGNMGTVFVRGIAIGSGHHVGPPLNLTVVAQATNTALVHRFHSECHAEANAVSACSKLGGPVGLSLEGTTCYVTRAPCTDCYRLLATAGVQRIVCPQSPCSDDCTNSIEALNIEWIIVQDTLEEKKQRDEECSLHEDSERVQLLRKERKLVRELEKGRRKKRRLERQQMDQTRRDNKKQKNEAAKTNKTITPTSTTT
jgi:dCMP deaminase|tara:strand:+ start:51 stop:836 length:786 start_codon:yes stop_codon:yes gene_type:complete